MTDQRPTLGVGLYPGTFDPITNGHLDIIARSARMLRRLVVGVAMNAGKGPLFPLEERVELVKAEMGKIADHTGTEIEVSDLIAHVTGVRAPPSRCTRGKARYGMSHSEGARLGVMAPPQQGCDVDCFAPATL